VAAQHAPRVTLYPFSVHITLMCHTDRLGGAPLDSRGDTEGAVRGSAAFSSRTKALHPARTLLPPRTRIRSASATMHRAHSSDGGSICWN
jgi:hypothetical protein